MKSKISKLKAPVFRSENFKLPKKFTTKTIKSASFSVTKIIGKESQLEKKEIRIAKKEISIKIGIKGRTKIFGIKEIIENSPIK